MKPPRPYIGVTGFMDSTEVADVLSVVPTLHTHDLMCGVLVSSKTLMGQKNKHPGRYPDVSQVPSIFGDDCRVLNLVHFSTDDDYWISFAAGVLHHCQNLHGFQFNACWPDPAHIAPARRVVPERRIVLQIGKRAQEMGGSAKDIARRLRPYVDVITDVLVDASGGRGLPIDEKSALPILDEIAEHYPNIGIGIAGGLDADSLASLDKIIERHPRISIDAEGRLRTPRVQLEGTEPTGDALELGAARRYVEKAYSRLGIQLW